MMNSVDYGMISATQKTPKKSIDSTVGKIIM
jgi:hypothetical protein